MTMAHEQQVVLEIPEEIRALKARIADFVRTELHPFEAEIARRGEIDEEQLQSLRKKARAAGFSNLNMPVEYGGIDLPMLDLVAIEEEAGKATNGLGFIVVDRGPRELLEAATPEQIERWVMPVVRGETREAWAITEPGAGSDVAGIQDHRRPRWRRLGAQRREVVRHRRRSGQLLHRAGQRRRGADALSGGQGTPGLEVVREPRFMHDPYTSKHSGAAADGLPRTGREPRAGRRRRGRQEVVLAGADHDRRPLLRRRRAADRSVASLGAGAGGVWAPDLPSTRRSSSCWPTR